jgi:hypothetical protein
MEQLSAVIEAFTKSASLRNIAMGFRRARKSLVWDEQSNAFTRITPDTAFLGRPHTQAKPVVDTLCVEEGLYKEHGWAVFTRQGSRRCLFSGCILDR